MHWVFKAKVRMNIKRLSFCWMGMKLPEGVFRLSQRVAAGGC